MPIDWHGEPSIVERFPNDIILVIAEDLAECCAYGSISALSMASHQLKRMLQPFLAQSKKKIWMRLEDWDWDEGDNTATDKYADIGLMAYGPLSIVECSADTPLPINHVRPTYTKKGATGSAREERFINLHCRPWMLLWQGHPHRSILTVCERFFPRIDILKVVVDTGVFRICDLENLAKIKSSPEISMAVNKIALTLMEKKVAAEWSWGDEIKVPRLRYMRHDNHRGMYPITYGRITSSVQAVGKAGFEYDRHEWSYYGEDEDLAEAEGYYLHQATLPQEKRRQYISIRIDMHIGTPRISGLLFYKTGETSPFGYNIFADLTESFADQHLSSTEDARMEFRLFHNHGKPLVSENTPIFSMSIAASALEMGKLRVTHRSIDENFANCRLQRGCRRCKDLGTEIVEIS